VFEIGKAIHLFIDRLVSQFSTSKIEKVIIETQFCCNPRTLSLASTKNGMIEAAMHAALLSQGLSTFTITSVQTKQYLSQFNYYQQTTPK
jgi:hypothetical protein